MSSNDTLAAFQALLLDTLSLHIKADDILQALYAHEDSLPFRAWIAQMEPRMLEVGAELIKKWGKQTPPF